MVREAAKKRYFFSGPATKRGRSKGFATEKKYRFMKLVKNSGIFLWPLSSRGLSGLATKTTVIFFRLPYFRYKTQISN